MANRITRAMLDKRCDTINALMGTPRETCTKQPDKTFTYNVGNYHLDSGYGGYKLAKISNAEGGTSNPMSMGYEKPGQCYELLSAFIAGIREAKGV